MSADYLVNGVLKSLVYQGMTEVCRQNHNFPLDEDQTGFTKKNVWAVEEPPVTPISTLKEYVKYRVRQWEEMYLPPKF